MTLVGESIPSKELLRSKKIRFPPIVEPEVIISTSSVKNYE
jgi:hypothetical protein